MSANEVGICSLCRSIVYEGDHYVLSTEGALFCSYGCAEEAGAVWDQGPDLDPDLFPKEAQEAWDAEAMAKAQERDELAKQVYGEDYVEDWNGDPMPKDWWIDADQLERKLEERMDREEEVEEVTKLMKYMGDCPECGHAIYAERPDHAQGCSYVEQFYATRRWMKQLVDREAREHPLWARAMNNLHESWSGEAFDYIAESLHLPLAEVLELVASSVASELF